ncbi:META and DUF4377 domain-containing protein [Alcaligenes faecalis]|uniref:META and DUF4377 domain-containing protein n=1 Tax=Alcaligenes faecalis TaxID=511 RepID=UPI000F0B1180|nr:META and DUF4377 domain-containing protein [Alcaligenes faecalis]AYR18988.1 DUF4377 domain-containing protein [Alcaligenes faecalis]
MKSTFKLTIASIALMGLAACAAPNNSSSPANSERHMDKETALQAYHWRLFATAGKDGQPAPAIAGAGGEQVTLNFTDKMMSVDNLCNVLGSGYTLKGSSISFTSPVSTMKMCADPELMRNEHAVGKLLPTATTWSMSKADSAPNNPAPVLTLSFKDGTQWRLKGEPTATTRYGSEPTRMFLEVAAQRQACSHPLMPNYQCLKVREIQYNDSGVKTHLGEWMYYYGDIEGYTHTPGVRNVLRINRYELTNVPADASSKADVLDMVVESEQIGQ